MIPEANPCTDRSANRSAGLLFAYVTLNSFQGFHGHAYLAFISDLRCVGRSQWREDGEVQTLPCYMITVPLRMKDYQRGGIFTVAPKRSESIGPTEKQKEQRHEIRTDQYTLRLNTNKDLASRGKTSQGTSTKQKTRPNPPRHRHQINNHASRVNAAP